MPRFLFFPICALIFSLPAAMLVIIAWPLVRGRVVPAELNTDMAEIAAVALLLGSMVALMIRAQLRRKAVASLEGSRRSALR